jgi:hypothetical protein
MALPKSSNHGRWRAQAEEAKLETTAVSRQEREGLSLDEPSSDDIEIVVRQLRRMTRAASLEFALSVGALIIHHFYGGNADAWRSRGPKLTSFRRLAAHPDIPLSAGGLYRCVALYELCDRLNAPSRWEHLGASHLRLVLGLPHGVQVGLLSAANANRWTVRTLHQEVKMRKSTRSERGGRVLARRCCRA